MADAYARSDIGLDAVSARTHGWVNHVRYANTVGLRKRTLARLAVQPPPR